MIDIDNIKLTCDLSIAKAGSAFIEYEYDFKQINLGAIFSLKHRQATLTPEKYKRTFDFLENIQHRVLREMAKRLGVRLFLVIHDGDDEQPPFDIHEVNIENGTVTRRAHISGQKREAWQQAWRDLQLCR